MINPLPFLSFLVVFLGIINLFRLTMFLIGSDIYSLKKHLKKGGASSRLPSISVIIPAYNEEKNIRKSLSSVLRNTYPQKLVRIAVVDDGSTDSTSEVVKTYIKNNNLKNVTLITQNNLGKAHALNAGIKSTKSDLVMCLDADSYLETDALEHAVTYFENKKVTALAANVKIVRTKGFINHIQIVEYILAYHMKRAQTAYNIEYIIGGIGSTFRRSYLEKINFYDTNTVTEDIDITMKILRHGNKNIRVVFGSDVIAHTEGALRISDLIRQRYRWKWGRFQTFLKNRPMFFSNEKKYTKGLSWIYLPYSLFGEITFLLEPILISYIMYLIIRYQDVATLLSALFVISFYIGMSIIREDTLSNKTKIILIFQSPIMYFLFYLLSFVEYTALIKSLLNMPNLKSSLLEHTSTWKPIQRLGFTSSAVTLD